MNKIIGLFDLLNFKDRFKKKTLPNLALMKLSQYYKRKGYKTEFYSPILHYKYHKIFVSKIFIKETLLDRYIRKDMIIGGSGVRDINGNLKLIELPKEIEHIYPDYELYDIDFALGFLTRGCIRNCGFCIVPEKEGYIRKNADLEEFTKDQKKIRLLDNNILAYKHHIKELEILANSKKEIDFTQGLDFRLINSVNIQLIKDIKLWNGERLKFALDNPKDIEILERKLDIIENSGIRLSNLMFYILVGFNTTEDEDFKRIDFLKQYRIDPYVMPFDKENNYQHTLCRYVNQKNMFWSKTWEEYLELNKNRKRVKNYLKKKNKALS